MRLDGARILITTDAVGGVWTYTMDLAGALVAAGATVRVVTLGPRPGDAQRVEALRRKLDVVETGHTLEWMAPGRDAVRLAGLAVARLARAFGADVVQLNTPALAADARFAGRVVAVNHSCVATWWAAVHGSALPERYRWCAAMTGEGLAAADVTVAPTAAFATATREVHALPHWPRTVHNGRITRTGSDGDEIDEVFAAGRLWDQGKNVQALNSAAGHVAWPVRAAGDMAKPEGGRVRFAALKATGHWPGERVRRHLALRPIFVSPARYEPFGLAILEAAQAGCALVLNDIPSLRELWSDAALFVDADDPDDLAGGLQRLIDDRARRRALGLAAKTRARAYSVQAMAEGMMAVYGMPARAAAPALVDA